MSHRLSALTAAARPIRPLPPDAALHALALSAALSCTPAGAPLRSRQLALYVLHVGFGLSFRRLGAVTGRHWTSVAAACHAVEQARDEPQADLVAWLVESALLSFAAAFGLAESGR